MTYPSRCSSARSGGESQVSGPYSDATWMTRSGIHPMGKGQVLYTGPSGIRDYKVNVVTDDRMVGIGTMSNEGTSALQYIWRGAPGAAPPRRRSKWVGEIGWFIPPFHDSKNAMSGNQIQLRVFRKAQEEKYTHRFQEPSYPAPGNRGYTEMFPFTQGSKSGWYKQQRSTLRSGEGSAETPPPPRPHTVASFHSNEQLPGLDAPNVNSNNYTAAGRGAHPPTTSAQHPSVAEGRPESGHSVRSVHFRPASMVNSLRSTPPGSRPGSGGGRAAEFDASHRPPPAHHHHHHHPPRHSQGSTGSLRSGHSQDSRVSRTSTQSRGSSTAWQPKRQRITPTATSVSSSYRAPMSDPEY